MTFKTMMRCAGYGAALTGSALATSPVYAETNALHQALGAPEALTINATARARIEGIDGQYRPHKAENDFLFSTRLTLNAEYDAGPIRLGAEIIDARGYGHKKNSSIGPSEINALELAQAYVALDLDGALGSKKASLTAGRYVINIGSKRLAFGMGFANSPTAYTGAYFNWQSKADDKLILFWGMPHGRLPKDAFNARNHDIAWDRESTKLQFFGAHLTKANIFGKGSLEIYGYGLTEQDSITHKTHNRRIYTPGFRLFLKPASGVVDYDIEAAYQIGKTRGTTAVTDVADLDVAAYFAHAQIGTTLKGHWSPRISLHADILSGDSTNPKSYTRFDTLYGGRRGEFGPTSLYGAVSRSNLISTGIRVDAKPGKTVDMSLMYRALWLQNPHDSFAGTGIRDAAGKSGRFAGHQMEFRARYWVVPDQIRLEMGAVYLAKRNFLKHAPNAPATGDTRYAFMDVTFEF